MLDYDGGLFTPHTRSLISRRLHATKSWKGTRAGYQIELELSDQPTIEGDRVRWKLRSRTRPDQPRRPRRWYWGTAGTPYDALTAIELKVARIQIEARPTLAEQARAEAEARK